VGSSSVPVTSTLPAQVNHALPAAAIERKCNGQAGVGQLTPLTSQHMPLHSDAVRAAGNDPGLDKPLSRATADPGQKLA
jgi:hypothetical protein